MNTAIKTVRSELNLAMDFINIPNKSNKLNISTRMGYHLIDGLYEVPSDFTPEQGLHYFEHSPGLGNDQRNYYVADMKLHYGDSTSYIYFNKWDQHWGPGINSLTISNKIPSFLHFGFNWELNEQIHCYYGIRVQQRSGSF